jgi:hypothetical protein
MSHIFLSATSAFSAFSARTHFDDGMRSDTFYFHAEVAEIAENAEGGEGA